MDNIPLVILLGLVSTTQVHLAKAMQRQGIVIFDRRSGSSTAPTGLRKPAIYILGVILNNTVFIYQVAAQPHGPPALFSSMFGVGLVVLMLYAWRILGERIHPGEIAGSLSIITGTVVIGLEALSRPAFDRSAMRLEAMLWALGICLAAGGVIILMSRRANSLDVTALGFGLLAGGLGTIDPFLKGVAQNLGGTPQLIPTSGPALVIFIFSFISGFLAFLVTQVGFAHKTRASVQIPAYNATFVLLPLVLQLFLLPNYAVYPSTLLGTALVVGGLFMFRRQAEINKSLIAENR